MNNSDEIKKLYVDSPSWERPIQKDDFLVAIGKKQTNSVYHIVEVSIKPKTNRIVRYNLKVFKSDLITCLRRDNSQCLIPFIWNSRKKSKHENY